MTSVAPASLRPPGDGFLLLDALNDAVVVAGADNRILYANQALERLLGWDPAAVVGLPVTVLVPERLRSSHLAGFTRYLTTGRGTLMGRPTRVPAVAADGQERVVDLVLSAYTDTQSAPLVVALLRDPGNRLDLERQTAMAHHLLRVITEESDDDGLLTERILAALGESLDMVVTALWLPLAGTAEMECAGFWNDLDEPAPAMAVASRRLGVTPGVGLPGRVWASGEPAWIPDLSADDNFLRAPAAAADGLRSAFAFPVQADGVTLGVIELFTAVPSDPDEALLDAMEVIGRRLGRFLRRRQVEEERRRLAERERAVAASLQRSLLPPRLPEIDGVDLGVRFHPGGELVVGGDFYDVFPIPPDRPDAPATWGLAIGDVCGTGPDAAAITAHVRYTARALAKAGRSPGEVLAQVNDALLERGEDDERFCTCLFGVLTPHEAGATLRLANAGHPLPIVRRSDGRVEEVEIIGPLLGVLHDIRLREHVVELGAGDFVLLFTDGVTESRTGTELFGDARLQELVGTLGDLPSGDVAEAVEGAARDFAGGGPVDDIAVLVVRLAPNGMRAPSTGDNGR
ncbi:MAG TPA: SpoIIE family protein phosphatase [Acidimicrobiales bacterium]|nr:SpoIIE family protein phosphatase [Acidimicrobiales bacterium]